MGFPSYDELTAALAETARIFHARGWAPATSGNYSAVLGRDPLRLAVSASGLDKAVMGPGDFVTVDERGQRVAGSGRPSDETAVHVAVVRARAAGAVLHTHSVWATVLSQGARDGAVELTGLELLKGLAGVTTHEHVERVPVVPNTQDYERMAAAVTEALAAHPSCHGLLLRGHGLYAWGRDLAEARRHVEALEFLFEVVGRLQGEDVMATIRMPDDGRTIEGDDAVRAFLGTQGIDFERWPLRPLAVAATAADVLSAYGADVDRLKAAGGYVTADVIDVRPETEGLEVMLAKFRREHWHDEDEVRFILEGRGVFFIHPRADAVFAIEVGPGDLIRVPRGTWHWFDLCADRRIRAIRLFQDVSGWTPRYTDSGAERGREPVCLGPQWVAGRP